MNRLHRIAALLCALVALPTSSIAGQHGNGSADTLRITGGASNLRSRPDVRITQVTPKELSTRQPTVLTIRGSGFAAGTRVFLQRDGQRAEAQNVSVLDSSRLRATVLSPFSPGGPLDLVVQRERGAAATMPAAMKTPEAQSASQSFSLHPTNNDFAFIQVPLRAPTREAESVEDPNGHPEWPSFLDSPNLLVVRAPGDTAAVMWSLPDSGLGMVWDAWSNNSGGSMVRLHLDPPRYATSLGTLMTTGKAFKDTTCCVGDQGVPIVKVRLNYENGDSTVVLIAVGTHVRNWNSGSAAYFCTPPAAFHSSYDIRPTDPLNAEVYSGAPASGNQNVHYDLQEIRVPGDKRSQRIVSVEFRAKSIPHCTGYAVTSSLNGVAVWPHFEIRNRNGSGGSLGLQTQFKTEWATQAYGGYIVRDTLFGAHRTIRKYGCIMSCMAMVNSYYGDSVTVLELDRYLARNMGFEWSPLVKLDTVGGQSPGSAVTFTVMRNASVSPGDTILFENGKHTWTNPLVTVVAGATAGTGVIIRRHQTGVVLPGMTGGCYDDVITSRAAEFSGKWVLQSLGGDADTTPKAVERTLTDSLPVLLTVRGNPVHFVLARGWRPTVGASAANGTYVINDPGHGGVSRLTDRFLVGGQPFSFNNTFSSARACRRTSNGGFIAGSGIGGMRLLVRGGRLRVTDPLGRYLYYDTQTGIYYGTIPDAMGWPDYAAGLDDDPDPTVEGVDLVELPGAPDGDYNVVVLGDGGPGTFALSGRADDPSNVGAQADTSFEISPSGGMAFNVHLQTGGSPDLRINMIGPVDVQSGSQTFDRELRISPNPARGNITFGISLVSPGWVELEVYDIAGRLVSRPLAGAMSVGRHTVSWNGRSEDGVALDPGLYFARLRTGTQSLVQRFIVVR